MRWQRTDVLHELTATDRRRARCWPHQQRPPIGQAGIDLHDGRGSMSGSSERGIRSLVAAW